MKQQTKRKNIALIGARFTEEEKKGFQNEEKNMVVKNLALDVVKSLRILQKIIVNIIALPSA